MSLVTITNGQFAGRIGRVLRELPNKQIEVRLLKDRNGNKEKYEKFDKEDLKYE